MLSDPDEEVVSSVCEPVAVMFSPEAAVLSSEEAPSRLDASAEGTGSVMAMSVAVSAE
jgi:hypothetical protein